MSDHYDLITIGGGSGGIATSIRAAGHGARCALVADTALGGTCVHRGCVPKKILWYAADIAGAMRDAPDYGFDPAMPPLDWAWLKRAREDYLDRLAGIYRRRLAEAGVELIEGRGRLVDARTVEANGRRLTAGHIVVATGGRPIVPDLPGAGLGLTSDGLFTLAAQPRRVAIVGAGYVAAEFGSILQLLGSEVTVVLRGKRLVAGFDRMLGETLMQEMKGAGARFLTDTSVTALEREDGGTVALLTTAGRLSGYDTVLWAVGRAGNVAGLGLEAAGIEADERGFIPADEQQNTATPGIYAVGDVTGHAALTPLAIATGRRLADRLFGMRPDSRLDYATVPTVVFSHPPLATVGLSEEDARQRYGEAVRVYRSRYTPLYHAITSHKVRAAVKLITAGEEERIVGCHMAGPGVEEILQGFAVAIRMGATKRDFDETVAIHPSGAEELLNMR